MSTNETRPSAPMSIVHLNGTISTHYVLSARRGRFVRVGSECYWRAKALGLTTKYLLARCGPPRNVVLNASDVPF